jgi:hypothetical protein
MLKNYNEAMQKNPGIIPVVYVEAPAPENGSFNWGDFFKRFLHAAHEPMIGHKVRDFNDGLLRKKSGTVTELR